MSGRYEAFRRTNEFDLPRPAKVERAWVVLKNGYRVAGIEPFSDNARGKERAATVAQALNDAFHEGQAEAQKRIREAQKRIREALGIDQ